VLRLEWNLGAASHVINQRTLCVLACRCHPTTRRGQCCRRPANRTLLHQGHVPAYVLRVSPSGWLGDDVRYSPSEPELVTVRCNARLDVSRCDARLWIVSRRPTGLASPLQPNPSPTCCFALAASILAQAFIWSCFPLYGRRIPALRHYREERQNRKKPAFRHDQ